MENKNTSRRPMLIALLIFAPFIYKVACDIYSIAVKDGKATATAMAKK